MHVHARETQREGVPLTRSCWVVIPFHELSSLPRYLVTVCMSGVSESGLQDSDLWRTTLLAGHLLYCCAMESFTFIETAKKSSMVS